MTSKAGLSGLAIGEMVTGGILLWSGLSGQGFGAIFKNVLGGKSTPIGSGTSSLSGVESSDLGYSGTATTSSTSDTSSELSSTSGSRTAASNQALAKLSVVISHPSWATGTQWQDWVNLWNRESGWNNLAQNPGSGAFGIAQALGHGTAGTAGKYGNEYGANYGLTTAEAIAANNGSALPQIQWGINYIADTYGSPEAAWAHEESAGWY